jgi:hypothetical protein
MSSSNPNPHEQESGGSILAILCSLGLGAALMYFFDPDNGRRRRDLVRDQFANGRVKLHDATEAAVHAAALRTSGVLKKAQQRIAPEGEVEGTVPAEGDVDTRSTPTGL